jgi:hypothetical protein
MKNRILYSLSLLVLISAFFMILYISYLLLWPQEIIKITTLRAVNTDNKAGKMIDMYVEYCKYKSVSAHVQPQLLNEKKTWLDDYWSNNPVGCHKAVISKTIIPTDTTIGLHRLRMVYDFPLNSFRTIHYEFTSDYFNVVNE